VTNLAQFLLVVVIVTLTFLIALIAVQVFQVLHEARQAIRKFNKILDNPQDLMQIKDELPDRIITPPAKKQIASVESSKRFFRKAGSMLRPRN
jgi:hypothetical protein